MKSVRSYQPSRINRTRSAGPEIQFSRGAHRRVLEHNNRPSHHPTGFNDTGHYDNLDHLNDADNVVGSRRLTLAHTAGTKYIDCCTVGTTTTAYPGDPAIDSHMNEPNAATPKCPSGQTWAHTTGQPGYDTPSGDLEIGDYAKQDDGTFITHYPATTYTDATSTVSWPDRITISPTDPTAIATGQTAPASPSTTTAATSSQ
jgi:hypothetical protein